MNACEWSVFLNALSISMAQGKSEDELNFLSLLLSQLSVNFALLASSPPGCQRKQTEPRTPETAQDGVLLDSPPL